MIVWLGLTVWLGIFRDAEATETAFPAGVFHSGGLAVCTRMARSRSANSRHGLIIPGEMSSSFVWGALRIAARMCVAPSSRAACEKWGGTPWAFVESRERGLDGPEWRVLAAPTWLRLHAPGRLSSAPCPNGHGQILKFVTAPHRAEWRPSRGAHLNERHGHIVALGVWQAGWRHLRRPWLPRPARSARAVRYTDMVSSIGATPLVGCAEAAGSDPARRHAVKSASFGAARAAERVPVPGVWLGIDRAILGTLST